jgi:hypothetical protein
LHQLTSIFLFLAAEKNIFTGQPAAALEESGEEEEEEEEMDDFTRHTTFCPDASPRPLLPTRLKPILRPPSSRFQQEDEFITPLEARLKNGRATLTEEPYEISGKLQLENGGEMSIPLLLASWKDEKLNTFFTCHAEAPSGATRDTLDAKIVGDGRELEISYKVSQYLSEPSKFLANFGDKYNGNHAKQSALNEAALRMTHGEKNAVLKMIVRLPQKVEPHFVDDEFVDAANIRHFKPGKAILNLPDGLKIYNLEMRVAALVDFGAPQQNGYFEF